eukprot:GEMP01023835.1.p1 GENE.GEMP01023835.1~~GEMP01023835.1.p1  ORF type:complete len:363 (+),score=33.72 GEMP01023835.1:81-1169(+)
MYHCIDLASMAADPTFYREDTVRDKYFENAEKAGEEGFPEGRLRTMGPISLKTRIIIGTRYFLFTLGNMMVFIVLLLLCFFGASIVPYIVIIASIVLGLQLKSSGSKDRFSDEGIPKGQYGEQDQRSWAYFDTKVVIPDSLRQTAPTEKKRIFCYVPHGIYAVSIGTGISTNLFAPAGKFMRLCCAPVLFKLPLARNWALSVGGIEAKKKEIVRVLDEGHPVKMILDGVAGMPQGHTPTTEIAYLLERKQICAIAKGAKAEIIPCFIFGTTELFTPILDPFGIIAKITIKLNVSLVPFLGAGYIPFGAPRRAPIAVCYGDPVFAKEDESIDSFHARLLAGYTKIFDTHKKSYGWGHKKLVFV